MIRKYIMRLTMLLTLICIVSCVDDKGNYTYIPEEEMFPVSISIPEAEANDNFIRAVKGEELHVTANVTNIDGSGQYSYLWYAFPNNSNATTEDMVELSANQNLDLASVTLSAGDWMLCFRVIDDERGVFKESQVYLTVSSSSFNSGWYVMKAKNDICDVDYFPNDYPDNDPTFDMISLAGQTMYGNPVGLAWQESCYCHAVTDENGTTSIEQFEAWHFVSDRDMMTFQGGDDMVLLKNYDEQFYTPPTSHNPQAFLYYDAVNHQFLLDGGDLYNVVGTAVSYIPGRPNSAKSIGKYTLKPSEHSYYPAIIPYSWSGDVVLFDIIGKAFYRYMPNTSSSNVNEISSFTLNGEIIDPSNMNADIVKLSGSLNYDGQTYILMHQLSDNRYRLAKMPYGGTSFFEAFNEVPENSLLLQSDFMAAPSSGDLVYFNYGNEVYYYRDAPGLDEREFKLFDIPADEQITYMACNGSNGGNYLIVVTSKGEEYKCYFHLIPNVNQPEVNTTPDKILTGTGIASRLMYKAW